MAKKVKFFLILFAAGMLSLASPTSLKAQCPIFQNALFNDVGMEAGHAFQGEALTILVITDSQGAKHTRIEKDTIFRDDRGNIRIERVTGEAQKGSTEIAPMTATTSVLLYDGCGKSTTLNPQKKLARIDKVPTSKTPPQGNFCEDPGAGRMAATSATTITEFLGHKTIAGVDAIGSRTRNYDSEEARQSGGKPATTVEHWCSPEFQSPLDLFYLSSKDAQEITRQVLSIKRAEPDPALFQIPAGYTFVHSEEKPPVAANAS